MATCGAYLIRPYADDKNLIHFSVRSTICMAVCGAYVVAPYPDGRKFIRFLVRFYPMQKKIAIFPGIRVGAYCIRPTNDHDSDRMSGKTGVFGVRFYPEKKKIVIFPGIRVGAYCIRPTGTRPFFFSCLSSFFSYLFLLFLSLLLLFLP